MYTDSKTGAGTNDVVLTTIDVASVGFLNDTNQQFDYNTTFPWGLEMGDDANYAGMYLLFGSSILYKEPVCS